MAKKPRTPPPPRKVQAPKQRHAPRQGLDETRRRQLLFGAAGLAVVAVVVALVVVLSGGKSDAGSSEAIAATMRAAGCTFTTRKASPSAQHITSFDTTLAYLTYPPVGGTHYAAPAVWGNYTREVDPRQAVHNQEHGGIVIWVGPDVSSAERQHLNDFYDSSPNAILITPIADTAKGVKYPKHAPPDSKIYLTAWTAKSLAYDNAKAVIAACPRFDENAFAAFRDEFRGKGPERFPVSQLQPGT